MTSIAQAYVEILPSARGMGNALQGEMGGLERTLGDGSRRGFMSGFANLAGPLAAVIGGLGIGRMVSDSIAAASDLSETRSAVQTVFGDASAAVEDFAANANTALGMTQQQALEGARQFGIFGGAANLAGDDLSTFSTDMLTLATDFASFNNVEPDQAIAAIGAGLRGESEPLRQFGILLDDAALKARAMELGIYNGNGALSQQQRVLAAQAEIMAQAGVQAGDFARTSDGLANQQRILQASWAEASATMGSLFLPAATAVVSFANSALMPALNAVISGIAGVSAILFQGDFTSAFAQAFNIDEDAPIVDFLFRVREGVQGLWAFITQGDFTSAFRSAFHVEEDSPIVDLMFTMREALAGIGDSFAPLVPQILEFATSFSPLSLIFQSLVPVLPQIAALLTTLAATLGGALGQALQVVVPILTQLAGIVVGVLTQAFTTILPVIVELVGMLGPIFGSVLAALMPAITMLGTLFATLVPILMPLVQAVLSLLTPILSLIAPLVQLVGAILPPLIGLFLAIVEPVLGLAMTLLSALMPAILFIVNVLSTLITWISTAVQWFVDLVTGAGTASDDLRAIFEGIPQFIADIFSGIGTWLVDSGKALIQGFIDGISGMIGAVGDAIGGVMDFVAGFFPNSPAKHGPLSGSGWRALGKSGGAIEDAFASGFTGRIDDVLTSGVQVPRVPVFAEVAQYAAGVGGSGATVNVYPSQAMDEYLVGDVVGNTLARVLR